MSVIRLLRGKKSLLPLTRTDSLKYRLFSRHTRVISPDLARLSDKIHQFSEKETISKKSQNLLTKKPFTRSASKKTTSIGNKTENKKKETGLTPPNQEKPTRMNTRSKNRKTPIPKEAQKQVKKAEIAVGNSGFRLGRTSKRKPRIVQNIVRKKLLRSRKKIAMSCWVAGGSRRSCWVALFTIPAT